MTRRPRELRQDERNCSTNRLDLSTPLNLLTGSIIKAALEVHRALGGPGLLESVYEDALASELTLAGHRVRRQQEVRINYKGRPLTGHFKLDLLVEDRVLVECKATTVHQEIFRSQTLTYLRLCNLEVGLLINFGAALLRHGIHRIVNTPQDASARSVSGTYLNTSRSPESPSPCDAQFL